MSPEILTASHKKVGESLPPFHPKLALQLTPLRERRDIGEPDFPQDGVCPEFGSSSRFSSRTPLEPKNCSKPRAEMDAASSELEDLTWNPPGSGVKAKVRNILKLFCHYINPCTD